MEGQHERTGMANDVFVAHMTMMADGPAYQSLAPADAIEKARRDLTGQLLDGIKEFSYKVGIVHIHTTGSENSCRTCNDY